MIELVIVIIVLSVIVVLSFISIKYIGTSTNLYAQVAQLASDLRSTQSLSMAKNEHYRLVTTSSGYNITNSTGTIDTSVTLGSGISATTNTIIFNSKGIPYINDTTPLNNTMTITLSTSSDSASASITPVTGQVTVP